MSLLLLFSNYSAEYSLASGSNSGSQPNVIAKADGDMTQVATITAIPGGTPERSLRPVMPTPTIDPNTGRPT